MRWIVLGLFLMGCAPRAPFVAEFGDETKALAGTAERGLFSINAALSDAEAWRASAESPIAPDSFEKLVDPNVLQERLAAVRKLARYGEGLAKLANCDAGLEGAAEALGGAGSPFADSTKLVIALVETSGRRARDRRLLELIRSTNPALQQLASQVATDFGRQGSLMVRMDHTIDAAQEQIRKTLDEQAGANVEPAQRARVLLERAELLHRAYALQQYRVRLSLALPAVAESATKMSQVHQRLANVSKPKEWDDVDLVAAIGDFANVADDATQLLAESALEDEARRDH